MGVQGSQNISSRYSCLIDSHAVLSLHPLAALHRGFNSDNILNFWRYKGDYKLLGGDRNVCYVEQDAAFSGEQGR